MRLMMTTTTLAALAGATACASGSTMVLEPPAEAARYDSAQIERSQDTVSVDPAVDARFEESLDELLFGSDGRFERGDGLTVRYGFVQLDEGSQAARYFIGFGAGTGELTVAVTFLDADGREMATVHTGGRIIGGVFGGSFVQAVDRAAMETAEYAEQYFAAPID